MDKIMDAIKSAELAPETDEQVVQRLAALSLLGYEKQRDKEAKKLGVRPTILDKLVSSAQKEKKDEGATGGIVDIATKLSTFFHDASGDCYATFKTGDHEETWPLRSDGFVDWLSYKAYQETGSAPGDSVKAAAIATLRGKAKYEGDKLEVYMRCAPYKNGYLIDLCNESWQVVHVTSKGWEVLDNSPLKFIRSSTAKPLPMPLCDGSDLGLLWKYINVAESDRTLVLAFILESWRPNSPYPLLFITGEQGCGKSCTHKYIRQVSDPNTIPLRTAPKSVEDVYVSAGANHQASFENMSNLSAPLQDALCSLATGGGFAKRKLYSDADESVIDIKRPIIINGISNSITRPDLIDRTVRITAPLLKEIGEESALEKRFKADAGAIFSGLLNLFAGSLKILPAVNPATGFRMAEFVRLGEAIHQELGNQKSFTEIYRANRADSLALAIESVPVIAALREFVRGELGGKWNGTIKNLKEQLERQPHQSDGWPKSAKGLSDGLRRMAPALRSDGIDVIFEGHKRDGNHVSIFAREILSPNNLHEVHTFTQSVQAGQETTSPKAECERVKVVNVKTGNYSCGSDEEAYGKGLLL